MAEIESHKIANATETMQVITAIARGETEEPKTDINPLTGKWETTYVPADLKTRLNAWKEILKRYPLSNGDIDSSFEYVSLQTMERALDVLLKITELTAQAKK